MQEALGVVAPSFLDTARDYSDKIRLRKVIESGVIKYRLEYSSLLRPYNENAKSYQAIYVEPPVGVRQVPFEVFLSVSDANRLAGSLGMATADIDDSVRSLFKYKFYLSDLV